MNTRLIRDLLLQGVLGVSGNIVLIDFEEPDAPRQLMDELLKLVEHEGEMDKRL